MEGRLLRAQNVAQMLSVPEASVYTLARQGELPGVVKVGRRVRFDPQAIEEFIKTGGQALPGGWRREAK